MRKFILLVWLASVVVPARDLRAEPVRLAILVEDQKLSSAADLLTVELSHHKQIELLERAQINKVRKEQALSASHGDDYLRLGELLGADGVMVLDVMDRKGRALATARLAAVKPGVILDIAEYEFPLADAAQWCKLVAQRFAPLFPKLGVLPKDAIPVSMLGLRFAVKTAHGEAFERALNLLLVSLLLHQPDVFVLERQKLRTLADEKELKGLGDAPFWNGSYLLEGTIDKEGFQKNATTISARLSPPGNRPPLEFEVQGDPGRPEALIEKLASKILLALNQRIQDQDWQPKDEANRFFEEATWALRWGMIPEAQAAADSAWALGRKDLDCALVRVQAWTGLVPHLPESKRIEAAAQTLEAYSEFCRTLRPEDPEVTSSWYVAGVQGLNAASQVLQTFAAAPGSQPPIADKLRGLRGLARSVAAWMAKSPSAQASIFECELDFGGLWQERPEEGLALYRNLMTSVLFPKVFQPFSLRANHCPLVIAWNAADQKRVPSVWRAFLTELNSSTNLVFRLQAKFLEVADAKNDPQREAACSRLFAFISANYKAIATNGVAEPYLEQANTVLPSKVYASRLVGLSTDYEHRRRKEFLTNNTPLDPPVFYSLFYHPQFTREQAMELLPLLASYETNVAMQLPKTGFAGGPNRATAIWIITYAETRLKNIVNPAPPVTASSGPSSVTNIPIPTLEQIRAWISPRKTPPLQATNALLVTRYFKMPWSEPRGEQFLPIYSHHLCNSKLWFDLRSLMGVDGAAVAWDPRAQTWETIPYPVGDIYASRMVNLMGFQTEGGRFIEEFQDALYASEWYGPMKRYDFKTRHWESLPIPVEVPTQLFAVADHLYGASSDSIFEILEGGQRTRLLASCRRRPVACVLDSIETLGPVMLFPGPEKSLRASVGNKVYSLEHQNWREVLTLPGVTAPPEIFDEGVVFGRAPVRPANLWLLPTGQTQAELCVSGEGFFPMPRASGAAGTSPAKEPQTPRPSWKLAAIVFGGPAVATIASNLYVFLPITNRIYDRSGVLVAGERQRSLLMCFDHNFLLPLSLVLKFGPDPSPHWNSELPWKVYQQARPISPWIAFTPEFLLIGHAKQMGVWAVPRSEIEAAFAVVGEEQRTALAAYPPLTEKVEKGLLSKYDSNHDGVLDRSERFFLEQDLAQEHEQAADWEATLPGKLAAIIVRFDRNHDGKLNGGELSLLGEKVRAVAMQAEKKTNALMIYEDEMLLAPILTKAFPRVADLLEKYDANKDGGLDAAELKALAQDLHKKP